MTQRAPELRLTSAVEETLAQAGYADAVTVLFSLLFDPAVDDVYKRRLDHFPYRRGTRELSDDSWYVIYSVDGAGNVMVYQMFPRNYIDQLPVWDERRPLQ